VEVNRDGVIPKQLYSIIQSTTQAALSLQQQDEQHWRQQKQPAVLPTKAHEPIPLHS